MPLPEDPKLVELAERILKQFDTLFGLHPGFRPAHAKGLLLAGTFTPAASGRELCRAEHLKRASTPVFVRFSNSTGLPKLPDTDPNAEPVGMAIRFQLGDHRHTDIVAHSTDGFPGRNGEEFLGLLEAIGASDPTKKPDPANPSPVEKFVGSHPAALAFVTTPKPPPASFATEKYFGVTAMLFTSPASATRAGRYQIVPAAGTAYLDAATAATKSPNYRFDELPDRLKAGPIEFTLRVQLANPGDTVDDATIHWPADRPVIDLGQITLTSIVDNNAAEQQQIIFDPIPRLDGIAPSADPLLELRAAIYLISGRRRRAAKQAE